MNVVQFVEFSENRSVRFLEFVFHESVRKDVLVADAYHRAEVLAVLQCDVSVLGCEGGVREDDEEIIIVVLTQHVYRMLELPVPSEMPSEVSYHATTSVNPSSSSVKTWVSTLALTG